LLDTIFVRSYIRVVLLPISFFVFSLVYYFYRFLFLFFFFFNDTATTEIYTLSLHDALPIWSSAPYSCCYRRHLNSASLPPSSTGDRKSTRLNSSHLVISYAVFCLKKKKHKIKKTIKNKNNNNKSTQILVSINLNTKSAIYTY